MLDVYLQYETPTQTNTTNLINYISKIQGLILTDVNRKYIRLRISSFLYHSKQVSHLKLPISFPFNFILKISVHII